MIVAIQDIYLAYQKLGIIQILLKYRIIIRKADFLPVHRTQYPFTLNFFIVLRKVI